MMTLSKQTMSFRVMAAILLCWLTAIGFANPVLAKNTAAPILATDPILGKWKAIDDKTGLTYAIIAFKRDVKNNTIYGQIVKTFPRNKNKPLTHCTRCRGQFKNKPIQNMVVLWNIKPAKKKGTYDSGYGIDPISGNIYRGKGTLSKNGNTLKLRGMQLEVGFVGRTVMWVRAD